MKQYLSPEQTTKLIELGFEKPKSSVECELPKGDWRIGQVGIRKAYSIGELIEMLPNVIESEDSEYATLQMYFDLFNWIIEYTGVEETQHATSAVELIDALYDMILKLKEEGVI